MIICFYLLRSARSHRSINLQHQEEDTKCRISVPNRCSAHRKISSVIQVLQEISCRHTISSNKEKCRTKVLGPKWLQKIIYILCPSCATNYLRRSTGRQNSTSAVPQTTNLNTNNMGCRLPGRFACLGTKKTNQILLGGDTTVTHPRRS